VRHSSIATEARTRLACVKHAASVRSEPGSNSRLKLDAWRKKMPSDFESESQPAKRIIVARFTQTIRARKGRMVSNGFWHIVSVVKERDLPVQQKGYIQLEEYLSPRSNCQHQINVFHSIPQVPCKSLPYEEMQPSFWKRLRRNFASFHKIFR
jgi:hypothetical protein